MKSERTKSLKKKRNIFGFISFALWIGTALFLTIFSIATKEPPAPKEPGSIQFITEEAKDWLFGLGITAVIGVIATMFIKERMRTFIWMISLIMAVILFGKGGMFTILVLWFIDEYTITPLCKHYGKLYQINKEIDLREK